MKKSPNFSNMVIEEVRTDWMKSMNREGFFIHYSRVCKRHIGEYLSYTEQEAYAANDDRVSNSTVS